MVLFNNIPYKRMRLTSRVNLTKLSLKNISMAPNNQILQYVRSYLLCIPLVHMLFVYDTQLQHISMYICVPLLTP